MLVARSWPVLLLPSLTTQTKLTAGTLLQSPFTVSTFNRSANLGNLPAPPLEIYSSSFFSTSASSRTMGSDSSKANGSPAGNFPKAKSDEEWRTVLSPAQVSNISWQKSTRRMIACSTSTTVPLVSFCHTYSLKSYVMVEQNQLSQANSTRASRKVSTTVLLVTRHCTSLEPNSRYVVAKEKKEGVQLMSCVAHRIERKWDLLSFLSLTERMWMASFL